MVKINTYKKNMIWWIVGNPKMGQHSMRYTRVPTRLESWENLENKVVREYLLKSGNICLKMLIIMKLNKCHDFHLNISS